MQLLFISGFASLELGRHTTVMRLHIIKNTVNARTFRAIYDAAQMPARKCFYALIDGASGTPVSRILSFPGQYMPSPYDLPEAYLLSCFAFDSHDGLTINSRFICDISEAFLDRRER